MPGEEAQLQRRYLCELLFAEGRGRQRLVMLIAMHIHNAKLVNDERRETLLSLLTGFQGEVAATPLLSKSGLALPYLLSSQSLMRLCDCCQMILVNEHEEQAPLIAGNFDEEIAAQYELDSLDTELFKLIHLGQRDPLFRKFFEAICWHEVDLFSACAGALNTQSYEISCRLRPQARLCTSGLVDHLAEFGGCLDDICRINARVFCGEEKNMRISAVGIGPMGIEMVRELSRNHPDIVCHEVAASECEQTSALLAAIRQSDLFFILTAFDDENCGPAALSIGHSLRTTDVLSLVVSPGHGDLVPPDLEDLTSVVDTVFTVPNDALAFDSMSVIVTAITDLLHQESLVGIDFVDFAAIMRGADIGRLGVGVASGPNRGKVGANLALERLTAQSVLISDVRGVLVIIQGSTTETLDDFNAVSEVIHSQAVRANILIGMTRECSLGDGIKVIVMTV